MRLAIRVFQVCGLLIGTLALLLPLASAGEIWDGGGVNDFLENPQNWDNDTLPNFGGAVATLQFGGAVRLTPNVSLPINPLHIQFPATAGAFVFGGANSITMGSTTVNGDITNNSAETQTFNVPVIIRRGRIISSAGDLVLNGTINIGDNANTTGRSLTVDGPNEVFLNGNLEGTGNTTAAGGNITKQGAGILHVAGNSPLWGGRIGVDAGILRASTPNALGDVAGRTLVPTSGGGRLELTGGVTFATERLDLGGRLTGSSPVHLSNFSGNNTWTGPINLATGGGEYGIESAADKLIISGDINNNTGNSAVRTLRFSGAGQAELTGNLVRGATTTGPWMIRKDGAGAWTFNNATISIDGDTNINGGSLVLAAGAPLDASPNITMSAGTTLDVSATAGLNRTAAQTLTGSATILGNLTDSGSTITVATHTTAGTLAIGNHLNLNGNGILRFDLANVTTEGGGINDLINVGGNLSLAGQTTIAINPIAGALANGSYRLLNYAGTLTGDASNLFTSFGSPRQSVALSTATPNQVNLVVTGNAANLVWMGDGLTNVWDVNGTANWKNGANPDKFIDLDNVTFDDTGSNTPAVEVAGTVTPGSITVNAAQDYSFVGFGKITGTTGITKNGTGRLTIANGSSLVGTNDFSGTIAVNAGTLAFNSADSLTLGGAVSGSGSLEKAGAGILTFVGDGSFTGTTTVNGGTLQLGNNTATGSLGTGDIILNTDPATPALQFNRNTALVVDNLISGTGSVDKRAGGTIEFTKANTYTGSTTINSGILVIDDLANGGVASSIGQSTSDAANLHIRTNGTLRYVGPGVTTDRLFRIGNARIEANGAGPLVFANTGAIATSGGNRTLTLQGTNTGDNTLSSAVVDDASGTTGLTKTGPGTWIINGANTYSGVTTISEGILKAGVGDALGSTTGNTAIPGDIGGSGQLWLLGGIPYAAEPINLGARQAGTALIPHIVSVTGANTWTGPISLVAGGFEYNIQSNAGSTLTLSGDITQTLATLDRFLNLMGDGDGVVSGRIINGTDTQVQHLRKRGAGTWQLTGVNTYQGATEVQAGVLIVGAGGEINNLSPVNIAASSQFNVAGGIANVGNIAGDGTMNVAASGASTANHARVASLSIQGALSRLNVRPNGTDAGASVFGTYNVDAGGILDLNDNDAIVRATAATKDGVHAAVQSDIASAQNGVDENFITNWNGNGLTSSAARNANVASGFDLVGIGVIRNSDIDVITGLPGSSYTTFSGQPVTPDDVLVKYTYIGDGNLDGLVSFDDYVGMDNAFFGLIPNLGWATGDINFDGVINFDDYTVVDQAFFFQGAPLSGEANGVAAVPEPATWIMVLLGGWLCFAAARNRLA